MIGEISVGGIYMPWLLVLALAALLLGRVAGWVLARLGFYRLVWHPPLFDAALFILILSGLAALPPSWFQ